MRSQLNVVRYFDRPTTRTFAALGKGGLVIETLFTSLDGGEQMMVVDKGENNGSDGGELAM